MENNIDPSTREGEEPAYDNLRRAKAKKRKAVRSSSSDSSSSSTSSSSDNSNDYNHKRRRKNKRKKQNCKFDQLLAKISDLENKLEKQVSCGSVAQEDCSSCDLDPNISGDLYEEGARMPLPATTGPLATAVPPGDPQFDFSFSTKVKEPAVPHASSAYLEHLKVLQHFDQSDWNSVRYVDAQKQYVHAPGFTSLEPNAEISNYDNAKFTAHMETAFSGLTFALLKQSEVIRNDMREFLNWVQQEEQLSHKNIFGKLNDIFTNGEYPKITSDLFQITCGHRAELIQYRRDAILASVKDPVQKQALKKIPPSCATLFGEEKFSAVLDKAGGVRNTFWPKNKDRTTSQPQSTPGPSRNQTSTSHVHNQKTFRKNRNETKSNNQHQHGSSHNSYRGKNGRHQKGRQEQYKGRKTGSPSSHRERSSQHKRKY